MKRYVKYVPTLMIGLSLVGPVWAGGNEPSASIPSPDVTAAPVRHWQGTATETPGIYSGPVVATVTLDLNPDGTFVETWKDKGKQRTTSGTWHERGKEIVLESSNPSHARQSLRRRGNALYTIAMEPLPTGRATTTAIELHPTEG
jgi:hypothetical protein